MAKKVLEQTEITNDTRQIVYQRQKGFSPFGNWLGESCDYHHVVNSGLGVKGVGWEWNIIALTRLEHQAIHNHQPIKVGSVDRYTYEEAITLMKNHLKLHYPNWCEEKCKVHKGWEKEDYGIMKGEL